MRREKAGVGGGGVEVGSRLENARSKAFEPEFGVNAFEQNAPEEVGADIGVSCAGERRTAEGGFLVRGKHSGGNQWPVGRERASRKR